MVGKKLISCIKLLPVYSNRNVNLSASRLLLLSVIRPSIDGSEMWEGNKGSFFGIHNYIARG